jgi:hypothetical protein
MVEGSSLRSLQASREVVEGPSANSPAKHAEEPRRGERMDGPESRSTAHLTSRTCSLLPKRSPGEKQPLDRVFIQP